MWQRRMVLTFGFILVISWGVPAPALAEGTHGGKQDLPHPQPKVRPPDPRQTLPGEKAPLPKGPGVDVKLPLDPDALKGPPPERGDPPTPAEFAELQRRAVHVEGVDDRPGPVSTPDKKLWFINVSLSSGKVVKVGVWAKDKPPLQFCNWILLKDVEDRGRGGLRAGGYEKVLIHPPGKKKPPEPKPPDPSQPPSGTNPQPPPEGPKPQPPQPPQPPKPPQPLEPPRGPEPAQPPPGTQPQPPAPKQPNPGWAPPPPEIPPWLVPWWEALKYIVPGSEFAGALPGGKDVLGNVIALLNVEIRKEMAKNPDSPKLKWLEQMKETLQKIYHGM